MEKDFFWKESQSIPELKKAAKAHKAKLAQALADFEQERAALAGQLDRAARELQAAEKVSPLPSLMAIQQGLTASHDRTRPSWAPKK